MSRVDYLSNSIQCPAPEAEHMTMVLVQIGALLGVRCTETVDLVLIWKVLNGEEQQERGWEGVGTRRNKVS